MIIHSVGTGPTETNNKKFLNSVRPSLRLIIFQAPEMNSCLFLVLDLLAFTPERFKMHRFSIQLITHFLEVLPM